MTKLILIKNQFLKAYGSSMRKVFTRNSSQWSEASSLILVSRNNKTVNNDNGYDYKLLMAKRSSKSSFMSNAYIFPGGKLDNDDFSNNWLNIFGHTKINSTGNRFVII
jgi:hypothetical protein